MAAEPLEEEGCASRNCSCSRSSVRRRTWPRKVQVVPVLHDFDTAGQFWPVAMELNTQGLDFLQLSTKRRTTRLTSCSSLPRGALHG